MAKLTGQTAIVTGASSGIGEAIARHLAREGATVVITARRQERLDKLKLEIEQAGGKALRFAGDINGDEFRKQLVDETMTATGRIDALINNAGYGQRGPVEIVPLATIRRNFETNFFSAVALSQLVIPVMRTQQKAALSTSVRLPEKFRARSLRFTAPQNLRLKQYPTACGWSLRRLAFAW